MLRMRTFSKCVSVLVLPMVLSGCGGGVPQDSSSLSSNFARQVNGTYYTQLVDALRENNFTLPLHGSHGFTELLPSSLLKQIEDSPVPLAITVPVGEHRTKLMNREDVLWVTLPVGDDQSYQEIEAVNSQGMTIKLSLDTPPALPTIVIASEESPMTLTGDVELASADDLLMLDKVTIADVKEPWARGDAEVYAVIAYIDRQGKGSSATIPLQGVTKAATTYDLRKIVHHWPKNFYKIVDINLFEHDTHHNFQELTIVLLKGAGMITSIALPGYGSIVELVAAVMTSIIKAMPKEWFEDSDDFIDAFNTVERNIVSELRMGVAGNASSELRLYRAEVNE